MERELAFLKRHAFLLAGVGLPLLLVTALLLARALPSVLVDDPQHELVYGVSGAPGASHDRLVQDVVVVDGRVVVRWNLSEEAVYQERLRVFRTDVAAGATVELPVPDPGDLSLSGGRRELELPGLEDVRIDPRMSAPDGYQFTSTWSGGGLFGEFFGGGYRGPRCRVEKAGRRIELVPPSNDGYGYGSVRFLGWAVHGDGGG